MSGMKNISAAILILILILLVISCQTQSKRTKDNDKLKTLKYAGIYQYGGYADTSYKGSCGRIIIYAESDDTVLFYIDLSRGAPSYNMGSLYGKLCVSNEKITFVNREFEYENVSCKWLLTFADSTLTIKTIDNCYNCGFGGGVIADNIYKKISSIQPDSFENGEGTKVFFAKTKPEEYYR
jgi:hypothetical protein